MISPRLIGPVKNCVFTTRIRSPTWRVGSIVAEGTVKDSTTAARKPTAAAATTRTTAKNFTIANRR
jgi:hypothetical protein